jgi:hypothetical protein
MTSAMGYAGVKGEEKLQRPVVLTNSADGGFAFQTKVIGSVQFKGFGQPRSDVVDAVEIPKVPAKS